MPWAPKKKWMLMILMDNTLFPADGIAFTAPNVEKSFFFGQKVGVIPIISFIKRRQIALLNVIKESMADLALASVRELACPFT